MTAQGPNFGNVELPENFSEKELRWSYWWVEHKDRLRKLGIAAFGAFAGTLLLIGLWGFIDWLAVSGVQEERAIRQLSGRPAFAVGGSDPQELRVDASIVLSSSAGKVDYLARVTNPNPLYWMEVSYAFVHGSEQTPSRRSFVLPGETKYLSELGVAGGGQAGELRILGRAFHRVDRRLVREYPAWIQSRLTIDTVDPRILPPDPGATSPTTKTTFTVHNRTSYSYYDVKLLVLAERGDSVVGVNSVGLDRLRAGEQRPIELFWYQNLPGANRIEVLPEINPFDPKSYRAPGT